MVPSEETDCEDERDWFIVVCFFFNVLRVEAVSING